MQICGHSRVARRTRKNSHADKLVVLCCNKGQNNALQKGYQPNLGQIGHFTAGFCKQQWATARPLALPLEPSWASRATTPHGQELLMWSARKKQPAQLATASLPSFTPHIGLHQPPRLQALKMPIQPKESEKILTSTHLRIEGL